MRAGRPGPRTRLRRGPASTVQAAGVAEAPSARPSGAARRGGLLCAQAHAAVSGFFRAPDPAHALGRDLGWAGPGAGLDAPPAPHPSLSAPRSRRPSPPLKCASHVTQHGVRGVSGGDSRRGVE